MSSDNIRKSGEHSSVAEELLSKVSDLEIRCRAVQKSVKKGYFSFPIALKNYKVNELEYFLFSYSKTLKEIEHAKKSIQILTAIQDLISVYSFSIKNFTASDRKLINSIKDIVEKTEMPGKILVK
jgi:hypothetical protein